MRLVMLAKFSASCFARWGFICISSAIVDGCDEVLGGVRANCVVYVTELLAWRFWTHYDVYFTDANCFHDMEPEIADRFVFS